MTEPAARVLARFCAGLEWQNVPAPARYRTQELLLDHLGVTVRGSMDPSTRPVREFVYQQGTGPATLFGASMSPSISGPRMTRLAMAAPMYKIEPSALVDRPPLMAAPAPFPGAQTHSAPAAWAALVNGTAAHAIEMDDVTTESSLHPGAAVIPAALAAAEEIWASGEPLGHETRRGLLGLDRPTGADVLGAIVAGYEVTIRVGNALGAASAYKRGFHPTGVAGVFGAAVAAGKLMRFEAETLERAIGIAGTMASGSLAYLDDGSWTKRLNPGWAAHAGLVAAGLARFGFNGPATALDGPHGLLRGYTDAPDPDRLTEGLGLRDLQVMRVSIKPYGCCRYSHGLIDAVLALRAEHGIQAEDVAAMRLGVLSGGWPLIAEDIERKRDPQNMVDAQFSAPYAAAIALVEGKAGVTEFERLPHTDPRVRELMARTECYRDPSLDAEYPLKWPAEAQIELRDGRIVRKRIEHALGEPENPVKREALVDRFIEMVIPRPEKERHRTPEILAMVAERETRMRAAAERILQFEKERDMSVLAVFA